MKLAAYQSIATDIAKRIVNEDFHIGDKISGRTLLAGQYAVSPETIRKAIGLLKSANIVTVSQGKEIKISSLEQARLFIAHQKEMDSAYSLKQELELLVKEKEEIDQRFHNITNKIMQYSDRLKNIMPYNPIEINITATSTIIGKSLQELNFRQETGHLVIAIRRGTHVFIAPDPNERLWENDRIVVIGPTNCIELVKMFLKK